MTRMPRGSARPASGRPRIVAYALDHARSLVFSLGKLAHAPLPTIMTVAVLGIALALPAGLFVALKNLQAVSAGWQGSARMSVFLHMDTEAQRLQALAEELRQRPAVAETRVVTREEALAEFRELSGFGEALAALERNPLPPLVVVDPALSQRQPERLADLASDLEALPAVDQVRLDTAWVRRLAAILEIAHRLVWVAGVLLAISALLVVGNTIRLDIQNRRQEIEVAKLIGATDAFIRRPFLYGGIWYGVFGGVVALLTVAAALAVLREPVQRLAGLYESPFQLTGLDLGGAATLVLVACLLGLGGAWMAVGRHLREIEPS